MGAVATGTAREGKQVGSGGGATVNASHVARVEFWCIPHEYSLTVFRPKAITLQMKIGKESLDRDSRSFIVTCNNEQKYFLTGMIDGRIEHKELSREDRISLRMKKQTSGYKMIRVLVCSEVKGYVTPDQIKRWANTLMEGHTSAGDDNASKRLRIDAHTLAIQLFNRAASDKANELSEVKRGFFS
ncbi:hypothetical protein AAMO2058_001605300 [Amorphochlora amoebiformis]